MTNSGVNVSYTKKRNEAGERLYVLTVDGKEYRNVTLDEVSKIIAERDVKANGST